MSDLYSMQEVLSPQFLSRAYTKVASLSIANPFLDFYDAKAAENQDGDKVEMVVYSDDREAAPINFRGAPAKTLDARGATKRYFSWIHAFNEVTIPLNSVQFLRMDDQPNLQNLGRQELQRQMQPFGRRHRALRAVTLAKALCDGVIYYDGNGSVLEDSTGAAVTVDLGVGASHKLQLAHASNSGSDIIGTRWDQAGAYILTDLEQIREAAEYDMVPQPRHVWMHTSWKDYIRKNTEIKSFLTLNSARAEQMLNNIGETLEIGDFVFHFTNATYVGADGSTVRPLIPKTKAIITPEVNDGDWFRHYEGAEIVPTGEGPMGSLEEALGNTQTIYGDFAYLRLDDNPVKVSMRMGMNFLYAFADPNAVWMPTIAT